jgi:hypothetical protein
MMPFVPQLASGVEEGRTIFTFRYHIHRFYPKTGEKFRAHCNRIPLNGLYFCRRRIKSSIGEVKEKYWKQIGMPSPEAYDELMKQILKTDNLDYKKSGYLYVFERIE